MLEPEIESGPGYLVKRVQQSLRRRCDTALRPKGLSMAQYAVLRALAAHPEATAADVARLCFVTRQTLQDVLGVLRSAGLIESADTPRRGRARSLQLTSLGRQRLSAGDAAVLDVETSMLQGIPAAAQHELTALLTRCAENLETR